MVAVVKRKKNKPAQYRFLDEHRRELKRLLGTEKSPARSTYFDRYRRAHRLLTYAIKLQGERAIAEGIVDATIKNVAADTGYDSNHDAERIEYSTEGRRTSRRFLCPENKRGSMNKRGRKPVQPRDESHRRRLARRQFYCSRRGKAIYRRRSQTVDPFNEWFSLFELEDRVWHRGLENNQTQLLAALFAYGLLVRYNHRRGKENAQIRWIIDTL